MSPGLKFFQKIPIHSFSSPDWMRLFDTRTLCDAGLYNDICTLQQQKKKLNGTISHWNAARLTVRLIPRVQHPSERAVRHPARHVSR